MRDITNASVRKKIIEDILHKSNVARKMESKRKWDFYKNNHQEYVYQAMCDEMSAETVSEQRQIFSINLAPKIIDEFASIYNKHPERTFTDASDAENDQLNEIYDTAMVDEKLKKANKMFKTIGQMTIQIIPRKGKLILRPLAPHMYDVLPDPECPEDAGVYILSSGYCEGDKPEDMVFIWWSDDYNFATNGHGNLIGEATNISNPIGRVPFVDVSVDKEYSYWVDEGSVIIDFAQDFIKLFSDAANIVRLQGFSQAVIYAEKVPEKLVIGASQVLHLPLDDDSKKDPKFEFVTPSPDLGNTLKFLDVAISTFLSSQGIEAGTVSTTGQSNTFNSGLERLLAMIENFEASQDDLALFSRIEREVFEILRLWVNTAKGNDLLDTKLAFTNISENTYIQVKYDTPEMIQTEKDRVDLAIQQVNAGLMSMKEAIMYIRQVDEQEAEQIMEDLVETQEEPEEENFNI